MSLLVCNLCHSSFSYSPTVERIEARPGSMTHADDGGQQAYGPPPDQEGIQHAYGTGAYQVERGAGSTHQTALAGPKRPQLALDDFFGAVKRQEIDIVSRGCREIGGFAWLGQPDLQPHIALRTASSLDRPQSRPSCAWNLSSSRLASLGQSEKQKGSSSCGTFSAAELWIDLGYIVGNGTR